MKIYKPSYFDTFRCIAAACPDSCCKEWDVQIDPDAARMYRDLPGELGAYLREALKEENGETVMTIVEGRCPMWRQDGLCRIQAELGHDALCKTCREFPRLTHDYGDFVELGLELSCPEAARIILSSPVAPFIFEQQSLKGEGEYDPEIMDILLRSRDVALSLVADPALSIGEALAIMLLYAYAVQEEIDGGEPARLDADAMLASARSYAANGDMDDILAFYRNLEILTPQWRMRLASVPGTTTFCDEFRPLAAYFLQRYWLHAVSDWDLVSRVKFGIISCLVICALGGDLTATAQLYSKEIENDSSNVEALLDAAYTCPAMTDVKLLGFLLQ